jgi:advillin
MYSLAELQAGCPAGVVANSKEKSLNDADFEATFKMTRDEFDAVPKWKRDKAKKDAGIF